MKYDHLLRASMCNGGVICWSFHFCDILELWDGPYCRWFWFPNVFSFWLLNFYGLKFLFCFILQTTASDSSLFDHLINIWEFNPGPSPGTCNLYFLVDFKFHSPLYRQVMVLHLVFHIMLCQYWGTKLEGNSAI